MGTVLLRRKSDLQLTMAMSGVKLTEACKTLYDDIQKGKKFRYGIFHIAGGMIDVEKIGERGNTYENFMTDLLKKDGDKDTAGLPFSTTSTSLPPRELRPRTSPRYFCCVGAQTRRPSRRRCCTPPASTPSREPSWGCTRSCKPTDTTTSRCPRWSGSSGPLTGTELTRICQM